ncbi:MAG: acyl-CoA dehydrogenase family protein [bacterium]
MQLSEEHRMFRKTLRDFLDNEIAGDVDELDKEEMSKEEALDYIRSFGELGVGPASEGGLVDSLNDPMLYVLTAEEVCRTWVSLNVILGMSFPVMFMPWTADETREAYDDRIESGELIGSMAVTEPDSGSDTKRPNTTAVRDGDEYVINGEKTWVSNAPIADMALVVAYDEEEEQRDFFIVDQETSSFETQSIHKLGWKAAPTGQMFFNDCRIPVENKLMNTVTRMLEESDDLSETPLSEEGIFAGEDPLNAIFAFMRTGMSAMAVGISQAALDLALEYSQQRETFGQPIAQHQLIQDKLYKIKEAVETSRQLTYHAAEKLSAGSDDVRMISSLAKGHSCEKCVEATSEALQVYGANGLSTEYPIERFYRDARMMTIPDGTTEIQKLIVGYELTNMQAYQ